MAVLVVAAVTATVVVAVGALFLRTQQPRDAYGTPLKIARRGLRPRYVDPEGKSAEAVVLRRQFAWLNVPLALIALFLFIDFLVGPAWTDLIWLTLVAGFSGGQSMGG